MAPLPLDCSKEARFTARLIGSRTNRAGRTDRTPKKTAFSPSRQNGSKFHCRSKRTGKTSIQTLSN